MYAAPVNYIVTAGQVRDYLELNSPGSSSKYSDDTIGSNLRAAQSMLEQKTHRFLFDRTAFTWATTTMLMAQVQIPGFRSFTSVSWGGSVLSVGLPGNDLNASCWAIAEQAPGVEFPLYTALQFRAHRAESTMPWWIADPGWFDKGLDMRSYPGNWGGGYAYASMPNDLVILGNAGYAPGTEPDALRHAVKVLASFYTMRPASVMANIMLTAGGAGLTVDQLPPEVIEFVYDWKLGTQVVSVG
jgi:hypothetical protein